MSGQQHAPAALYPRERLGTHCTGDWVGPRAGLDGRKKPVPTGIPSRTVQPVVSRYTDWATGPTITPYWGRLRGKGWVTVTFIKMGRWIASLRPKIYFKTKRYANFDFKKNGIQKFSSWCWDSAGTLRSQSLSLPLPPGNNPTAVNKYIIIIIIIIILLFIPGTNDTFLSWQWRVPFCASGQVILSNSGFPVLSVVLPALILNAYSSSLMFR